MNATARGRYSVLRAWLVDHEGFLVRLELGLAICIPLLFLLLAVLRARPFVDDTPILIGPHGELLPGNGDDWFTYKIHALNILSGGLAEPNFGRFVFTVHGFLYNYFVAGIFKVSGVNTSYVYVIQTFLVGSSPSILYVTARLVRFRFAHLAAIAFFLLASAQLYIDYFRYLSFLLMSENLFLPLFAVSLCAYAWAFRRRSRIGAFVAGILLGLTVLSRLSDFYPALGVLLVAPAYFLLKRRLAPPLSLSVAITIGFALAMALFPLREYVATGTPDVDVFLVKHGFDTPPAQLVEWPAYYGARLAFVFGIPQWLAVYDRGIADFRVHPHWIVIWLGVIGYLASRLRWRRLPDLAELTMLVFLGLYTGAYTFVGALENYGGRSVSVILPLAAVFGAFLLDDLIRNRVPGIEIAGAPSTRAAVAAGGLKA